MQPLRLLFACLLLPPEPSAGGSAIDGLDVCSLARKTRRLALDARGMPRQRGWAEEEARGGGGGDSRRWKRRLEK